MFAFLFFDGRRGALCLNEGMEPGGCLPRKRTEGFVEGKGGAPSPLAVVEGARGNRMAEHLFQAKRLCAKLNFVGSMAFRFPPLVFYGNDGSPVAGVVMKLDNIALAAKPKAHGMHGQAARNAMRSEERRVGKECRALCRSRWSPYH